MPGSKKTANGVLGALGGLLGLSVVAGVLIAATVTPAIAVTSAAASKTIDLFQNLPSYLEIDKVMLPTTILAKNRDNDDYSEIARFWTQNRTPVQFDQIAPVMRDALLSSEDPRFYQHGGVDLLGTTRAILSNAQGNQVQGASSISQQYVKNVLVQRCEATAVTDDDRMACYTEATTAEGTEGLKRKLQEMRYAIQLEKVYSKDEILLGYLNIANFGGTTYGIEAAAKRYFNVSAKDLSLAQASVLAGIVQNPNTFRIDQVDSQTNGAANGFAVTKKRQSYVLDRMLKEGKIDQQAHDEALNAAIQPVVTDVPQGCATAKGAEYFCQYVREVITNDPAFGATVEDRLAALFKGGLNIYTTLDWSLQDTAQRTMSENAPAAVGTSMTTRFGSTAVNIEVGTGRILAIAQNTRFGESADVATDPAFSSLVYAGDRQFGNADGFNAGSVFKLFTLVDWLEKGRSVNESINGVNRTWTHMTNSCGSDWYDRARIGNFQNSPGYNGTPARFTADSLNSGFLAMAEQLDLCDISKVAKKLGVTSGTGADLDIHTAAQIIGIDNVSPIAMTNAYATIAANGKYCEPQAIERVTDAQGNEIAKPDRACAQVLTPEVAATTAYALRGVMAPGGTATPGNPNDGTPVIGKTGIHEGFQTWLIESSTRVATGIWVGSVNGQLDIFRAGLNNIRFVMGRTIQRAANAEFPGGAFPNPAANLTRVVYKDVPSVIGLSIADATARLEQAGFSVSVGGEVDSSQPVGTVAEQNPAGSAPTSAMITISPSNGKGATIPEGVIGRTLNSAIGELRSSGFTDVSEGSCREDDDLNGNDTEVTSTSPSAGSSVSKSTPIKVNYAKAQC